MKLIRQLRQTRFIQYISRHWLSALQAPFTKTPGLMLLFFALQTAIPYYYYRFAAKTMLEGYFLGTLSMAAEAIVMSWSMLALYLLSKWWNRIAGIIVLTLCLIVQICNMLIDFSLLNIYHCSFTSDIAGILAATNPNEGADFIATYINKPFLISLFKFTGVYICLYVFGAFVLGRLLRRVLPSKWPQVVKPAKYSLAAVIVICWIGVFISPRSLINTTNLRYKFYTFCTLNLGHEIVPVHPHLIIDSTDAPQKIVVILGESHCRSHSSLYGYSHRTQPYQERLLADSTLFVFKDPVAPALHTMRSIQQLIGTYRGEEDKNWYECLTFLEAANVAGYQTVWLSNQSSKGVYDNPVVKIAEFCNEHAFTNDGMHGIISGGYDEIVLPLVDSHFNSQRKDLTVIHLMGNHISYCARFPAKAAHFKPTDYNYLPVNQRKDVADYDNSVLYNDYVVNEIIKRYENSDAIVIYLSDHAQDLFESSLLYKGHGKNDNLLSAKAGAAVPFTVYLSPLFQSKHPQLTARIKAGSHRAVECTDLIYTLMDVMGASFPDSDDVASHSFFRPL